MAERHLPSWVGLGGIEPPTSALSVQISFSRLDQQYALCIPLTYHIDIHAARTPSSERHSGHIPAQFWTAGAKSRLPAFGDNGVSLALRRDPARDTDRPFWTTAEHESAIKPRPSSAQVQVLPWQCGGGGLGGGGITFQWAATATRTRCMAGRTCPLVPSTSVS